MLTLSAALIVTASSLVLCRWRSMPGMLALAWAALAFGVCQMSVVVASSQQDVAPVAATLIMVAQTLVVFMIVVVAICRLLAQYDAGQDDDDWRDGGQGDDPAGPDTDPLERLWLAPCASEPTLVPQQQPL